MNIHVHFQTPVPTPQHGGASAPQPAGGRREYRPRDFGVGYGSSSGYARDRHCLDHLDRSPAPRFRCA
ncbi:hypothetical protein H0E84_07115 [Luteimonas sp. SJ-92]|uniref:Uncharacterized protein n=1 Tax=Luteimonas salinisoli TaxID=2752307 RepID=A0A853JBL0_9GAMM|nr:hypothetical protein [Luteimonas salinisoli]NZA26152.1 hypothetical protein [Luteimonas salinisoli]